MCCSARLARLLALLAAAVTTACTNSASGPSPTPSPNEVHYTAVGASDAVGVGASTPCMLFSACPDGTGYVPTIARELAAGGKTVTLMNLGIPAAVLGPGLQAIGIQYGRTIPGNFLEQEMPFVPRDSTVVTIFAGGNDTNTLAAAVGGGAGGSNPEAWLDAQIQAFAADYRSLIQGIRQRAPSATIVVANLPNFAGMPFTAGYAPDHRQLVQRISVDLDLQAINPLAGQGVAVVDMLCDPRSYDPVTYSSDGFHPGDAGYAYMASEMLEALGGSYPAPSSSCASMTIVSR
jgi:lysophospholipase L1-like esterase